MLTQFLLKEWKFLIVSFIIVCTLGFAYFEYKEHKSLPMTNITNKTDSEVKQQITQYTQGSTNAQREEIVNAIRRADTQPPQATFTAKNWRELDSKGNLVAKQDKADFVTKEEVKNSDGTITGVYKGVHTEKNNKIQVGVTVLDKNAYVNLGYQHEKNDVIIHYSPTKQTYGITYMRTIWEK
jgi:hypothetical protein